MGLRPCPSGHCFFDRNVVYSDTVILAPREKYEIELEHLVQISPSGYDFTRAWVVSSILPY